MPQLGETVTEGTILRWAKRPGDTVAEDEVLLEISTDKVDTDVPSPAAGTLLEILVAEGETVAVGSALAVIGVAYEAGEVSVLPSEPTPVVDAVASLGEAIPDLPPPPPAPPPPAPPPPPQPAMPSPASSAMAGLPSDLEPGAPPIEAPASLVAEPLSAAAELGFLSPVVRKLAREHDIDLTRIVGTGRGGRITRKDVQAVLDAPVAAPPLAAVAMAADVELTVEPSVPEPVAVEPAVSEPVVPEPAVFEPAELEPVAVEPAVPEPAVPEPAVPEPAVPEPAVPEPAVPEPAVPEPAVPEPVVFEPAELEPVASESVVFEPVVPGPVVPVAIPVAVEAAPTDDAAEELAPVAATAVVSEVPTRSGDTVIDLDRLRLRIADNMIKAKATAAHVWTSVEVDYEPVERVRQRLGADFKEQEGFSLTYLPFIARATVDALRAYPVVNSSFYLEERTRVQHGQVNLGIAVDLNQDGLVVMTMPGADGLRMRGIAREVRRLAGKARSGKIEPDDVSASSFTITNPGPFGSFMSAPIINVPNVGILSTDTVEKRPTVVSDGKGDDAIAIHHIGYLGLSWDHRAFDGSTAVLFLNHIRTALETWDWEHELV